MPFTWGDMTEEERNRFYHSGVWKRKREAILRRDHYECQECRKRIRKAAADGTKLTGRDAKIGRASTVHHIVELKDNPSLALDDENLEAICFRCHNQIHGRVLDDQFTSREPKKKPLTEERW